METPAPKRNNSSPQVDKDNASTIIDDPSITFIEGRIKHIRKDLPPLTLDDAINAACIVVLIWSGAELLVAGVECGSYCYYRFFLRNASAYSGETANITSEELAITESIFIEGTGNPDWILNKGYKPQPGERTFEGYVKNNVPIDKETKLFTKSSGFNTNPKNVDGQFKRFGVDGHGPQLPDVHVHQPTRNPAPNGIIYGGQGTKSLVDVNLPNRTDIKQLYEYLNNGKYHK